MKTKCQCTSPGSLEASGTYGKQYEWTVLNKKEERKNMEKMF